MLGRCASRTRNALARQQALQCRRIVHRAGGSCGLSAAALAHLLPGAPPAQALAREQGGAAASAACDKPDVSPSSPEVETEAAEDVSTVVDEISLWSELLLLFWENVLLVVVGTGVLVMGAVLQSTVVAKLTGNLAAGVMRYSLESDSERRDKLLGALKALVLWSGIGQLLNFAGGVLTRVAARKIAHGLQLKLYSLLLQRDMSLFDQHQSGELTQCVDKRVARIALVVTALMEGLPNFIRVPLTMRSMWSESPELAKTNSALIGGVVSSLAAIYFFGINTLRKLILEQQAAATSCVNESFVGVRTIQSFAAGERLVNRYCQLLAAPAWLETCADLLQQSIHQIFRSFRTLITVSTYYVGAKLMAHQADAAGAALKEEQLATFLGLSGELLGGLLGLLSIVGAFGEAAGEVAACEAILRSSHASVLECPAQTLPELQGQVAFEHVSFGFPVTEAFRVQRTVLSDLSLTFKPGSVTALVGTSGSGKSTVIQILQRFYEPSSGVVRLDGVDVRQLNARWLRRQLGRVEQEPVMFALSISDNIRLGKPTATDAEVEQAAKLAQAHEFIMETPDGYATMVTEQGQSLSGGQRQRLAIARALLMEPQVLIMDEATSALDGATEAKVMRALGEVMRDRTTVIIAHRLSTVASADQIIVLDQGGVAHSGTHASLMEQGGVYAELVRNQSQSTTD